MPHPLLAPAYELADGDKAFLTEILESMLNNIPEDIAGIERAIGNNQLSLVSRSAHHMKSSVMYTNAEELRELLGIIETMKEHAAVMDQINVLMPKVKELAGQVVAAIKADVAL